MSCENCQAAAAVALAFIGGAAPIALCRPCGQHAQAEAEARGLPVVIDEMQPEEPAPPPRGP